MASIDNLLVSLFVDEVVGGFLVTIPPGHVGCIYSVFGGVMKNVWHPGMHFKIPIIHRVKVFNAQLIEYTVAHEVRLAENKEIMGDEVINAVTSDNKFVAVEATALIKLNTDKLPEIWQNIGENFASKVIRPVVRSRIRKVLTSHSLSEALSSNRTKIEEELRLELRESLNSHGLEVENVYLSSLTPVAGDPMMAETVKFETNNTSHTESKRMSGDLV